MSEKTWMDMKKHGISFIGITVPTESTSVETLDKKTNENAKAASLFHEDYRTRFENENFIFEPKLWRYVIPQNRTVVHATATHRSNDKRVYNTKNILPTCKNIKT